MSCNDLARARLAQSPYVIDDVGASIQHGLHHLRFIGIDRNWHLQAHSLFHHGQHALQFILQWHGRAPRACGLSANIQDIRAVLQQLFCMRHGRADAGMPTSIRKRIRRHIHNAHDARPAHVYVKPRNLPAGIHHHPWVLSENFKNKTGLHRVPFGVP